MGTIAGERKKFADKYRRWRKLGKTREARAHWKLDLLNGPIGMQAVERALYYYDPGQTPSGGLSSLVSD